MIDAFMLAVKQRAAVIAVAVAVIYLVGSSLAIWYYKAKAQNAVEALVTLQGQVKAQNDAAAAKLASLTEKRDQLQAIIDRQAENQEAQDAQAKAEIARLGSELRNRPFRVRVEGCDAGSGDRGATSDATAGAEDRAGDTGPAYGLLPAENHRRLASAIDEIETMSAAYASCRARLIEQLTIP